MRTNIEIDDALMAAALKASGLPTKRAAVEEGLKLLVRLARQKDVAKLVGKVTWRGDLAKSRLGRRAP